MATSKLKVEMVAVAVAVAVFLSVLILQASAQSFATLQVLQANKLLGHNAVGMMSWEEWVIETQKQDDARLLYLTQKSQPLLQKNAGLGARRSFVPIASGRQIVQSPTYVVKVKVGTPPQTLVMAMDTSNDVAWLPCTGCVGCTGSVAFDPARSSTFKTVPCQAQQCKQVPNPSCSTSPPPSPSSSCSFNLTYGSSSIGAQVSQDTVALATDDLIPSYTFGCIRKATGKSAPSQGLLGLGRGPLSLLSQTQSLYKSTFSYCLPSFTSSPNFSGTLRLGPVGQPQRIKTTPLLRNPRRSSLYYVNLVGIKVGSKVVDIPAEALAFNPATGSGTVIDSGTVYTRLAAPAYNAVRDEFRRRMGPKAVVTSLGGFDTCYSVPVTARAVPSITFMFQGMNVTIPQDNFLLHSQATTTTCLAMAAAQPDAVNSVLNVIASMQQQNHRIYFDIPNSRLGVARERCT